MSIQTQDYFSREIAIPNIGREGFHKLQSSSVAIVGVGGVGSSAAYYLARSGVGHLKLIDQDIVESTNLQRLHSAKIEDLFHPKVEVLANRLSELDKWCQIEPIIETVTERNADELLRDVNLIFDGLDNFRTRYILNKSALGTGTPYLFASAVADQAHLALLNPPKTPCLECIMPHVTDRFEDSCETLGVSPAITGMTGAIGTEVALRFLLGRPNGSDNQLITIDMAGPQLPRTKLSKTIESGGGTEKPKPTNQNNRSVKITSGGSKTNAAPTGKLITRI